MAVPSCTFKLATTKEEFKIARNLFEEYATSLEIDLEFQGFTIELKTLSAIYSPPNGALILAMIGDEVAGCSAVRRLEDQIAELKRMYIKPAHRGKGIGKSILDYSIMQARALKYQYIRLDTLPSMTYAIHIYKSRGFYDIEPYRFNPVKGTRYLELIL